MNPVLSRWVSLLTSCSLPTLLSSTTPPPQPRHLVPFRLCFCSGLSASGPSRLAATEGLLPSRSWLRLRNSARRLAGRCSRIRFTLCCSLCYGRVVHFRQLPTPCCHDAVAFGFRRVNVPPDGDFHPAMCTPPQTHERGCRHPQAVGTPVAAAGEDIRPRERRFRLAPRSRSAEASGTMPKAPCMNSTFRPQYQLNVNSFM